MKRKSHRHIIGALSLAMLLGAPLALAQTSEGAPAKKRQHGMMEQKTGQCSGGEMPARCKAMMEKRQQMMQARKDMMARCKAMDARLDELVATMNTATGQQKIDAMAALLNELVQQRKAMHEMKMQQGMMPGMMHQDMPKGSKHKCKMMMKKMMTEQQGNAAGNAGEPMN